MRKFSLLLFIHIISVTGYCQQHFYIGFSAGLSSYKGDLGSAPFYLKNSNGMGGVAAVIQLNRRINIRGELNFGRINGADKYNIQTQSRNLSFYSDITEFALMFEYVLFDLEEYRVSPYFFGGVATFKFKPYAKTDNEDVVSLPELSTEGQGFYNDRKLYKLSELAIPFGGGVQWAIASNMRFGIELGLRKTSTDYLDDVSTTYVDETLLAQEKGSTAVRFAYRGNELPNGAPYPHDGSIRGNPDNNDYYIFTGIFFRISFEPREKIRTYQYKPKTAKVTCPTVF